MGSTWALGPWQGPPFVLLLGAVPVPPGMWSPCAQIQGTAADWGCVPLSRAETHQDPPGSQPEVPREAAGADVPSQLCAVPAVKAKPAEMLMSGKVTHSPTSSPCPGHCCQPRGGRGTAVRPSVHPCGHGRQLRIQRATSMFNI